MACPLCEQVIVLNSDGSMCGCGPFDEFKDTIYNIMGVSDEHPQNSSFVGISAGSQPRYPLALAPERALPSPTITNPQQPLLTLANMHATCRTIPFCAAPPSSANNKMQLGATSFHA